MLGLSVIGVVCDVSIKYGSVVDVWRGVRSSDGLSASSNHTPLEALSLDGYHTCANLLGPDILITLGGATYTSDTNKPP